MCGGGGGWRCQLLTKVCSQVLVNYLEDLVCSGTCASRSADWLNMT